MALVKTLRFWQQARRRTTLEPTILPGSARLKRRGSFQTPYLALSSPLSEVGCHNFFSRRVFLHIHKIKNRLIKMNQTVGRSQLCRKTEQIPWCFLSFIILVVAGPKISKFDRLMAKTVAIGTRTLNRFSLARKPFKPLLAEKGAPNDNDNDDDGAVAG